MKPDELRERFDSLYSSHYRAIYAYSVRRLHGERSDVQDVVAEVFTTAWRRMDHVPAEPDDLLWLYGVARNITARQRRTRFRRQRLLARLETEAYVDPPADDEHAEKIRSLLDRLPKNEGETLRLLVWEQLSHAEAARVLGCTENAVAIRSHRARNRIRSYLATGSYGSLRDARVEGEFDAPGGSLKDLA